MEDCNNINDIFSAMVRLMSFMTHYPDMVNHNHWEQFYDGMEILSKIIETKGGEGCYD